ncbi:protein LAZY 1-like [Camellia sinensis]|uniref:protein LAZY 1-like n=1 Tax=Camellia sinensis TaxID=4442 RepID=UPI001035EE6B|nr:protein LAZY 1-like [Camellia sinensis]
MKLLGWMHRRLRPSEGLKDFAIGWNYGSNPNKPDAKSGWLGLVLVPVHDWFCPAPKNLGLIMIEKPSVDEQQYDMKANYGTKTLGKSQRYNHLRKSFAIEEDDFEEDSSAVISQLFHGFLTIGTLGSDTVIADPSSTPTFSISVENITEKETEVTEHDLKLINDELEKVLGVEGKEDGCNDSSGEKQSC